MRTPQWQMIHEAWSYSVPEGKFQTLQFGWITEHPNGWHIYIPSMGIQMKFEADLDVAKKYIEDEYAKL